MPIYNIISIVVVKDNRVSWKLRNTIEYYRIATIKELPMISEKCFNI